MKLRNKKTGDIANARRIWFDEEISNKSYNSLAEFCEEWEDYEEPEIIWYINASGEVCCAAKENYWGDSKAIGNYFETKEEAEKAVEKLKAWKRLKDKNFHFLKYSALGCGEIEFSLEFEDIDDEGEIGQLRHDLDLLFGGEE